MLRLMPDRALLEQCGNRQRDCESRFDLGRQLNGEQRVTAEREKVVVDVEGGDTEQVSPDFCEGDLELAVNEPRCELVAAGRTFAAPIRGSGRRANWQSILRRRGDCRSTLPFDHFGESAHRWELEDRAHD